MLISVCLPVAEDVDESVNEAKLSAHEVSVADFLLEAFVVELDQTVDAVTKHSLNFNNLGGCDLRVSLIVSGPESLY